MPENKYQICLEIQIKIKSRNLFHKISAILHLDFILSFFYSDYFVSVTVKRVLCKRKCFDVFWPLVFLVPFSSSSIHQACNKETSGLGTTYLQKLYSLTTGKVLGRGHRSTKRKPPLFVR